MIIDRPKPSDFNLTDEDLSRCEEGAARYLDAQKKKRNKDVISYGICALVFLLLFACFLILYYMSAVSFDFSVSGGIICFSAIDGVLFILFVCFAERWFLALERRSRFRGGSETNYKAESVVFGVTAGIFFACVAAYLISYFVHWHDMYILENGYLGYDSQTVRFACITVSYSVLALSTLSAAANLSRKSKKSTMNATAGLSDYVDGEIVQRYQYYLSALDKYREYEDGVKKINEAFWSGLTAAELKERFSNLLIHLGYARKSYGGIELYEKDGESLSAGFKTMFPASAGDIVEYVDSLPPLKTMDRAIYLSVAGYGFSIGRPNASNRRVRIYAENKGANLVLWTLGDLLRLSVDAGATIYEAGVLPAALERMPGGLYIDTEGGAEGDRRFGFRRRRSADRGEDK